MEGWGVLEQAGELTRRGEAFALATVVWRQGPSSGQQGSRAIITASGELHGWIGGACAEPVVIREAQQVISKGEPRLLLLGTPEQFASGATTPKPLRARPRGPGSLPIQRWWGRRCRRGWFSCLSPARARVPWRSTSSRCC